MLGYIKYIKLISPVFLIRFDVANKKLKLHVYLTL